MSTPDLVKIMNPELATIDNKVIREYLAETIHWTASPKQPVVDTLRYCIYTSHDFYNYFVGGTTIYVLAKPPKRGIHCGEDVYLPDAIKKFPKYCPPTDNKVIPHMSSPNSCTIGICTYVIDTDGTMDNDTYYSLTVIAAKVIHDFAPKLDPLNDIVLHSFFTNLKQCHKFFVLNPDKFNDFKFNVKHLVDIYDDSLVNVITDYGLLVPKTSGDFIKVDANLNPI
jgi:hypothetical protein